MLVVRAPGGELTYPLLSTMRSLRGWVLSLMPVSFPDRALRPRNHQSPAPDHCRAHSRTLTQQVAVQFSMGDETLIDNSLGRRLRGGCPRLPVQAAARPSGQSPAESHDGQAEEGAEVRCGMGRWAGRPLGQGAEVALLWLVAG